MKKTDKPNKKPVKKAKPKVGRPSLLTDKVIDDFTSAVSIGSSYELSALYAGVSHPTVQNWMKLGRDARATEEEGGKLAPLEKMYLKFLRAVEEANGEAGIGWQETVSKAAKVDPAYALQMLRLRFPSGYGGQQPIHYTAEIDLSKLTDDQLERIAKGENPADVIANPSGSASGAAPTA